MKYIFSFFFCLLLGLEAQAQLIWPGDANNNGKVNAVDVLFVGLGYNAKGPNRTNASTKWEAQPLSPWTSSFPNGLNYAYADGNGDGEINDKDIKEVIEVNFGLTHGPLKPDGFAKGQKGIAPQLRLSTAQRIVAPGETVEVNLDLGNADKPVNFYGIAFQMGYSNSLVRQTDLEDDVSPWFETNDDDTEMFFVDPGNTGKAEFAFTLTNQQVATGFGRIGKVKLVIEDIIVGRPVDTLRITIDSVLLIDQNFKSTAIAHDTLLVFVTKDPTLVGTKDLRQNPALIKISPNPNPGNFTVETQLNIQFWELYDPLGRLVSIQSQQQKLGSWSIHAGDHPPGVYLLRGFGPQGFVCKSLIVTHS
jgi:hypothetical protein